MGLSAKGAEETLAPLVIFPALHCEWIIGKEGHLSRGANVCASVGRSCIYRFEKAALIQWRHERLTFGETTELLGVSKATLDRWAKQGKLTPLADMDGKQRWFGRADVERLRDE